MRSLLFVLSLCLVLAIAVPRADAGNDDAVRKALVAAYAQFSKAFQQKDGAALASLMSDNYEAVGPDGSVAKRKQVLADLSGQMAMLSDVTWKRTITHLTVKGTQAVAVVDGHLTGTSADKEGKAHKLDLVATTEDTWVKTGGVWKITHSKVQKMNMSFDGKPMQGR